MYILLGSKRFTWTGKKSLYKLLYLRAQCDLTLQLTCDDAVPWQRDVGEEGVQGDALSAFSLLEPPPGLAERLPEETVVVLSFIIEL